MVQQVVLHSDTVDPVTVDQGVGEPVEEVLGGQQRHPLVGCSVPPLPGLAFLWWHDALSFSYLKVSVVLHYDHPGRVPSFQDGLQHEEVVAVGVDGEKVECFLHFEPFEEIYDVVRPEDDLLQPDVRVLVTSVHQERLGYVPAFLLSRISQSDSPGSAKY